MSPPRKVAVVARILHDRAFAFLHDEKGDEFFLHRANCVPNTLFDELVIGDAVNFMPAPSPKGFKAMGCVRATEQEAAAIVPVAENRGNR